MSTLTLFLQDTLNLVWLSLSLFLAGVLEALLWKTPVFQRINTPINIQWFGANKKWRGLVSLPLACVVSTCFLQYFEGYLFSGPTQFILFSNFNCLEYGLLVGLVFNLSELPNSFIKRRLNIPAGDESNKLFYWVDHMDSTYGVLILWYFYFHFPLHMIITGFLITPLLFMGATVLRKKLGLK